MKVQTKVDIKKIRFIITLLLTLLVPLFFGEHVAVEIKAGFYALSLTLKSILITVLPFMVFSLLFSSIISLESGALKFIFFLFCMVYISDLLGIFIGYFSGQALLPFLDLSQTVALSQQQEGLKPFWDITTPKIIGTEQALLVAIVCSVYFSMRRNKTVSEYAMKLNAATNFFLKKIFLPVLPLFILGFIFKLEADNVLSAALSAYKTLILGVIIIQISYIILFFCIAANFRLGKFLEYIKNIIPVTLTAFSTMSSSATLPVSIIAAEKNIGDEKLAQAIVPATVNNHTIGSALDITILAVAVLVTFGHPVPDLAGFITFATLFALFKFAVVTIPGGAMIVVAPILESQLGFTPEMIGLITAMYMLLDPFGTSTNATCNGAFAIIFSRLYKNKILSSKKKKNSTT